MSQGFSPGASLSNREIWQTRWKANFVWRETFHLCRIGLVLDLIISAWLVHSLTHPGMGPDMRQKVFIWLLELCMFFFPAEWVGFKEVWWAIPEKRNLLDFALCIYASLLILKTFTFAVLYKIVNMDGFILTSNIQVLHLSQCLPFFSPHRITEVIIDLWTSLHVDYYSVSLERRH